jgi:thymidylate synthase (FAD)
MKVAKQSHEVLEWPDFKMVEKAGRTCYKSEDKMEPGTDGVAFTARMMDNRHWAMVEFATMTVRFITDRGVSHELVRHRLCSFAQESTRYCNYKGGVTFIQPTNWPKWSVWAQQAWQNGMVEAESLYQCLLLDGLTPQEARSVLPNSVKTEVVVKANFREWMHIFDLRCAKTAHPDMQALMQPLEAEVRERYPDFIIK